MLETRVLITTPFEAPAHSGHIQRGAWSPLHQRRCKRQAAQHLANSTARPKAPAGHQCPLAMAAGACSPGSSAGRVGRQQGQPVSCHRGPQDPGALGASALPGAYAHSLPGTSKPNCDGGTAATHQVPSRNHIPAKTTLQCRGNEPPSQIWMPSLREQSRPRDRLTCRWHAE